MPSNLCFNCVNRSLPWLLRGCCMDSFTVGNYLPLIVGSCQFGKGSDYNRLRQSTGNYMEGLQELAKHRYLTCAYMMVAWRLVQTPKKHTLRKQILKLTNFLRYDFKQIAVFETQQPWYRIVFLSQACARAFTSLETSRNIKMSMKVNASYCMEDGDICVNRFSLVRKSYLKMIIY